MTLFGLDASHHQARVDWHAVAAGGISFVVVKATESIDYVDPTFATNWAGVRDAGMLRSAYHFARPADSDPLPQAEHFLSIIHLDADDLPLCLDLEDAKTRMSASSLTEWAVEFLEAVDDATGRRSILYTGPGFISGSLGGGRLRSLGRAVSGRPHPAQALTDWPLWLAEYGPRARTEPWPSYLIWQNTDRASIPGIGGGVDGDRCELTRTQLAALASSTLPKPSHYPAFPGNMFVGDRGEDVQLLRFLMTSVGFGHFVHDTAHGDVFTEGVGNESKRMARAHNFLAPDDPWPVDEGFGELKWLFMGWLEHVKHA